LLDVDRAGLWPDFDAPPPVGGRLAMGIGEFGPAGAGLQCHRCPPVHEQTLQSGLTLGVQRGGRGDQTQSGQQADGPPGFGAEADWWAGEFCDIGAVLRQGNGI